MWTGERRSFAVRVLLCAEIDVGIDLLWGQLSVMLIFLNVPDQVYCTSGIADLIIGWSHTVGVQGMGKTPQTGTGTPGKHCL